MSELTYWQGPSPPVESVQAWLEAKVQCRTQKTHEMKDEHLDRKLLKGKLTAHIRQAVDGKKQLEDAMKLKMKLGPHSEAHKAAVRRSATAAARDRIPPDSQDGSHAHVLDDHTQVAHDSLSVEFIEAPLFTQLLPGH